MKLHALAVAAGIAVIASAAPVAAQPGEVVQFRLDEAAQQAVAHGFALQGAVRSGALDGGAEETIQINLEAGTTYAIVGVCDQDCDDMDLMLTDAAGRPIAQDILDDNVPVLRPEITRSGRYNLQVSMPACSVNPCEYGIAIFVQQ